MSSDEEEYIYPSSEEEYLDYELYDSEEENEEKKPSKPINKSGLNLQNIPSKDEDRLNDLYVHSLNADKTMKATIFNGRDKVFLNDLKMIKNRHIIEDAYNQFKKYIKEWRTKGGYPVDPALFISNATDGYNQKRKRSREIIKRSLKYHKKRQKRKQEEERRIKPTSPEARRKYLQRDLNVF